MIITIGKPVAVLRFAVTDYIAGFEVAHVLESMCLHYVLDYSTFNPLYLAFFKSKFKTKCKSQLGSIG